MVTPADYTRVGDTFKKSVFIDNTPMTLVTGMFQKFTTDAQHKELEAQFTRIGLIKSADGKWSNPSSLAGLPQFDVLTLLNTVITLPDNTRIPMEASVLLGKMVAQDNVYIYLENNGQQMRVPRTNVKVLGQ